MMKRSLLVTAIAMLAIAPAAHAASWKGVVIAKAPSIHAVVTASANGAVRTVRVGSSFRGLHVGRQVAIRATALADGTFKASRVSVGAQAATTRFEGIFLGRTADGSLRVAVAHRGEVFVAVPASFALPRLDPGDVLEVEVSVDAAGALTLLSIETQNDVNQVEEVEVEGTITTLVSNSITVTPRHGMPVTCAILPTQLVSGFRTGDHVEMRCRTSGTTLVLTRLRLEDDDEDGGDTEHEGHGGEGRH